MLKITQLLSKARSESSNLASEFMLLATIYFCQLFLTYNGWAGMLLLDSGHGCPGSYSKQDSKLSRKGQMCIFFMVAQKWNIFVFAFLFFRTDFHNTETKRDGWVTFDWFTSEIQNNSFPCTFWVIWILPQQGTFSNWENREVGEGKFLLGQAITKPNLVWSVWLCSETLQLKSGTRISGRNHKNSIFAFWQKHWIPAECRGKTRSAGFHLDHSI